MALFYTAAIDQVIEQRLGVHSLLVIRHGYAVLRFARRSLFGPL
jgi:hypothetical protein